MKKMLICGANGFIGRNALEFFQRDYDITAVLFSSDSPDYGKIDGVRYIKTDLRIEQEVKQIFEEQEYDVVIQAAATTTGSKDVVERPYVHVTDNVVMNAWILREATLNNVGHVLFPSCTVMYQPMDSPQSDDDWNAGVAEMRNTAKNIFLGESTEQELARASLWAAAAPKYRELLAGQMELNKRLQNQIKELKGATPSVDAESASSAPAEEKDFITTFMEHQGLQ